MGKYQFLKKDTNRGIINSNGYPEIVIDENLYGQKFVAKLRNLGYCVTFLGSGKPDRTILKYCLKNKALLVTADVEFDREAWALNEKMSLFMDTYTPIQDKVRLVQKVVEDFKK